MPASAATFPHYANTVCRYSNTFAALSTAAHSCLNQQKPPEQLHIFEHATFSVNQSVRLESGDQEGLQRLIQYFLRCPFSQARMIEVTDAGKVIYKTEHNAVGRFPEPGDEELLAGLSRNFRVFDPLDFLAEVTQHIPAPGEHLIRYYGWYSNKTRGQRTRRQTTPAGTAIPARSPTAREARQGWAALIRQVYESDPLTCPECGTTIRIIAFIERPQTEVIEKILRHCGLWEETEQVLKDKAGGTAPSVAASAPLNVPVCLRPASPQPSRPPLEPSPSLAEAAAALGSRPTGGRWQQQTFPGRFRPSSP